MESIVEITENIYQVHIPIPFPLKSVNCYLVREADGWTMIDTGLHHAPAYEAWEHAFRTLQMTARDIRRILLTHTHPDHYGLAGYFQRLSSAPVYALDEEIRIVPIEWQAEGGRLTTLTHFFAQHGAPQDILGRVKGRSLQILEMLEPQPVLSPLHEGQEICIGGQPYRVIWVPGHADGQIVFHRLQDGLMFIGDHVLMKITPNIGLWPLLDPNPLRSYLASLGKVEKLTTTVALPGHRAVIHDLPGRVAEIRQHHAARLQAIQEAAGEGHTAHEVSRVIFPRLESADDIRMGLVEVLSHLEYLVSEGQLERLEGKVVQYRR